MTDREKLIDLIQHEVVPYFAVRIADHLLANGVTVRSEPDKVTRALIDALARQKELCDICANRKEYPCPECYDADCDCSNCESDCACAKCDTGSNFRYGG